MKFDYSIKWYELAENKLLRQAQYILEQSQNVVIAENFYDGKYLVKFLIGRETVYIVDFKSAKQKNY